MAAVLMVLSLLLRPLATQKQAVKYQAWEDSSVGNVLATQAQDVFNLKDPY